MKPVVFDGGFEEERRQVLAVHDAYLDANASFDVGALARIWDDDPTDIFFNRKGHTYVIESKIFSGSEPPDQAVGSKRSFGEGQVMSAVLHLRQPRRANRHGVRGGRRETDRRTPRMPRDLGDGGTSEAKRPGASPSPAPPRSRRRLWGCGRTNVMLPAVLSVVMVAEVQVTASKQHRNLHPPIWSRLARYARPGC